MEVKVCIGTTCHRQGAEKIVKHFQTQIEEKKLTDRIDLKGSFCLGKCSVGNITVLIDGKEYKHTNLEEMESFFEKEILGRLD